MGNGNEKAKLTVLVSDITNTNGTYSATYTAQTSPPPTQGNGSQMPTVSVIDNVATISLFTDTNITFKLDDDGWTFPSSGTVVKVKLGDSDSWTDFTANQPDRTAGFNVGAVSSDSKELELEDEDLDGNADPGKSHQFCLQAVNGGATHSLDPNFWNRR
jgi:hypothetical protein